MTLYTHLEGPLGRLLLTSRDGKLTGLYFTGENRAQAIGSDWVEKPDAEIFQRTEEQLTEYAAGERHTFDIPLGLAGRVFQVQVWQEIFKIPFGQTITYTDLAKRAVSTEAIRAVGTAAGANPVSIIVPCHRVIGKNGSLTGYAGGLSRKQALLEFEAARSRGESAVLELIERAPELALA